MTDIDPSAPVLVTGGSGYVAGWIVRYLLEDGRTVRATVRDRGAYGHGAAAGGRVGLGRPVGAGPGTKGLK